VPGYNTLCAGIDLGWSGKPSGVALLRLDGARLRLVALDRCATHEATLAWVRQANPGDIGLDAPVIVRNATGMRECDKLAHRLFSRQHAGAYPVNLGLPYARLVMDFVNGLKDQGYETGLRAARRVVEVYPHAASVRLFGLERILPYKRGSLAARRRALEEYRALLAMGLAGRKPAFRCLELPEIPERGGELKAVEDQLDALLSAYVAAHFRYWGQAKNNVLGNEEDGYIVTPSF
jgi:predicted RNase H-like nuclease